jgi:hypothetical protein
LLIELSQSFATGLIAPGRKRSILRELGRCVGTVTAGELSIWNRLPSY